MIRNVICHKLYADRSVTLSAVWVRISLTLFAHQYQNKSIVTSIGCNENLLLMIQYNYSYIHMYVIYTKTNKKAGAHAFLGELRTNIFI